MATLKITPTDEAITDLYDYISNPAKTNESIYGYSQEDKYLISSINCPKQRAVQRIAATQKLFSYLKEDNAIHAYQSFEENTVSPELAHKIGIETMKKALGYKHEIIIATHMNKPHIHNHFLINPISLTDGTLLKINADRVYRFREISDLVCQSHNLPVLPLSRIKNIPRGVYWSRRNYGISEDDLDSVCMLKIMHNCISLEHYNFRIEAIGINCDYLSQNIIKKVKGPKKQNFCPVNIFCPLFDYAQLRENIFNIKLNSSFSYPLGAFLDNCDKILFSSSNSLILANPRNIFEIFSQLYKSIDLFSDRFEAIPISPDMRYALIKTPLYLNYLDFLISNNINTYTDLLSFKSLLESSVSEKKSLLNTIKLSSDINSVDDIKKECIDDINSLQKSIRTIVKIEETETVLKGIIEREYKLERNFCEIEKAVFEVAFYNTRSELLREKYPSLYDSCLRFNSSLPYNQNSNSANLHLNEAKYTYTR